MKNGDLQVMEHAENGTFGNFQVLIEWNLIHQPEVAFEVDLKAEKN